MGVALGFVAGSLKGTTSSGCLGQGGQNPPKSSSCVNGVRGSKRGMWASSGGNLHKDFRLVSHPQSLDMPEETREEYHH